MYLMTKGCHLSFVRLTDSSFQAGFGSSGYREPSLPTPVHTGSAPFRDPRVAEGEGAEGPGPRAPCCLSLVIVAVQSLSRV